MAKLSPLRVPKKAFELRKNSGSFKEVNIPVGIQGKDQLNNLRKDTAKLLEVTYEIVLKAFVIRHFVRSRDLMPSAHSHCTYIS